MTPRLRALLALALVVGLGGVALTVATARGWEAVAPPELPITTYAPRVGNATDYDATLDQGEFEVEGTRYAAELTGPARAATGGYYAVNVVRIGGAGGRVAITNLTVLDATGAALGYGVACADCGERLSAVADVPLAPGVHELRADAVVRGYREAAWGAWHTRDETLRFAFVVEVTGPR